jgi:serine protease Do
MKRAVGFGLVLLAASATSAFAAPGPDGLAGSQMFLSGSGAARTTQGYFGVDLRDIAPEELSALKLREAHGAEIVLVDHDAPAGKAGLRERDVVLQMNGQAIDGQDQLRKLLHDSPPGRTVVLVISRDGQQLTISTQMSSHEEVDRLAWEQHLTGGEPQMSDNTDAGPAQPAASAPSVHAGNSFIGTILMTPAYTGLMLEKMSPQLAGYFGVPTGTGLLIRSVQPNSPAANAGMQAGDVVVRADTHSVSTPSDWAKAMKNSRGRSISVTVLRDKKAQVLTLTPDSKKRSSIDVPSAPESTNGPAIARLGFSFLSGS